MMRTRLLPIVVPIVLPLLAVVAAGCDDEKNTPVTDVSPLEDLTQ